MKHKMRTAFVVVKPKEPKQETPKGAHLFSNNILLMAGTEHPYYGNYWKDYPNKDKDVLPVL